MAHRPTFTALAVAFCSPVIFVLLPRVIVLLVVVVLGVLPVLGLPLPAPAAKSRAATTTLEPDTEAFYLVTEFYAPDRERGLRYNDPKFGIKWPLEPTVISDKDKNQPDYNPEIHLK